MTGLTVFLGLVAWAATLAVAFLVGRMAAESHTFGPDIVLERATKAPAAQSKPAEFVSPVTTPTPTPEYPKYASTIPIAFRGRWDEIVADGCRDREARFIFEAKKVCNFEVEQDVSPVKIYSTTGIDVGVTGYDDDKNQYNDTMMFKLLDDGKNLTGRKKGASFYHRRPNS